MRSKILAGKVCAGENNSISGRKNGKIYFSVSVFSFSFRLNSTETSYFNIFLNMFMQIIKLLNTM